MQKVLSITAVAAGALYLAAGIGLLAFQDIVKTVIMGYEMETLNVYPVHNVLGLVIMGVPCMALGILSMSDSLDNRRATDMLLVIYSSVMLVLGEMLITIGNSINNIIIGTTKGVEGLANMSMVSAAFSYIQFLITLSLVLLLLRGAFGLGESGQSQRIDNHFGGSL